MTEFEAKQAIVDVVGAPWTVEDVQLREHQFSSGVWALAMPNREAVDSSQVTTFYVFDNKRIVNCFNDIASREALIVVLLCKALHRGAELPYDRVLREKAAAWAEEKAELEGKIEELEEALRIT